MKKLALLSLFGIAAVYLSTFFVGYDNREISSLSKNDFGLRVCVSGVISNLYKGEDVTIFNITDSTSLKTVFFEKINVSNNQNITVCGRLEFYKGDMEIQAHKLIKLKN